MAQSFFSQIRHLLSEGVLPPARRFIHDAIAALRAWAVPENNPFLLRALRIESRKHKPLLTIAEMNFILAVALILVMWLWNSVVAWPDNSPNEGLRKWLFKVFSENPINWLAMTTAAISAYAVLWCSRARAAYLLRQEVLKNTLVQLQQLPIAEERWIWQMAFHPALLGLLVGMCGLPMYALAVFTGQWRVLDVIGLLVLFFLLGHSAPSWQLAQWQQAGDKPRKANWKQWHESLKVQRNAGATGAQKLEAARRAERALSGDAEDFSAPAKPNKISFGNWLANSNRKQNQGWNIFAWMWAIWISGVVLSIVPGGAGALTASWPSETTALVRAFPITWPLFLVRITLAPLDFFAFKFPPFLLLIPLWIAFHHQIFLTRASQVSAAETFWTAPRAKRKSRVQLFITTILCILVCGYGWPLLMESALLARLLPGAPVTPNFAEAALFTLLSVLGALRAGFNLETPFQRARRAPEEISSRAAFVKSARIVLAILFSTFAIYFCFCWLGGRGGGSTPFVARMPLVVFTIIAFLLADFGSAAFGSILSGSKWRLWNLLRVFWSHWLALFCVLLNIRALMMNTVFSFDDAPWVLLSPFVTLFALFRFQPPFSPADHPLLWSALLVQSAIGMTCIFLAVRVLFAAEGSTPFGAHSPLENESSFWKWLEPLWKLGRAIAAFFIAIIQAIINALDRFNNLNLKIVRAGEKWDNAVLTFDLRRRVMKENWLVVWLLPLLSGTLFFLFAARPWELWTIGAQGGGGTTNWNFFAVWGSQVSIVTLIAMWGLGALAALNIGRAFDADRANGTLVFLFLTPQTDAQILIGKLLPNLIFVAGWIASGLIWLSLGGLVGTVFGGDKILPFIAVSGIFALAAAILFVATVNLFFAVRARKPLEGQSWALLFCFVFELSATFGFLMLNHYLIHGLVGVYYLYSLDVAEEIVACFLLVFSALCHLTLAFIAWKLALRAFAKKRYGDVEASGKGAS